VVPFSGRNDRRKDADPLAQKFFEKYEKLIKTPTPGFRYDQVIKPIGDVL
jgi:hypothetical protein